MFYARSSGNGGGFGLLHMAADGMLIPLSLFSVLGWNCIWTASSTWRVCQCRSRAMHWTPVWQMVYIISVLCYRLVVSPHKSDVSAVFQYALSNWSACLPYVHHITTSVWNPMQNSIMSVWNGGSFGWILSRERNRHSILMDVYYPPPCSTDQNLHRF